MPRKHDRHLQINNTIPIIPFNVGLFLLYNLGIQHISKIDNILGCKYCHYSR